MKWSPRLATTADIPALAELIAQSVRVLQAPYYTASQREAALGDAFGVDSQLIADGTYFVVEAEGAIVACGGWSRRRTLFGADQRRGADVSVLDPARDAARIRAFFVHPDWARRGLGRALVETCEAAIRAAGFRRVTLVATLAGIPLYETMGYAAGQRSDVQLAAGPLLPVVAMDKTL